MVILVLDGLLFGPALLPLCAAEASVLAVVPKAIAEPEPYSDEVLVVPVRAESNNLFVDEGEELVF